MNRLFIYGTLAPGRPNAHIIAPLSGDWAPATVCGRLTNDGWGSALGYPGIRLDANGPKVEGFVFTSDNLAEHWDRLDAFEGEGYVRVPCEATLETGGSISAWIYALAENA